ncbi:MAG: ORF6N domain-containing protein [Elusimicrobia bacterium]|nr:ORF6N domain-containing protein [Elusimicrobiota bacterium]
MRLVLVTNIENRIYVIRGQQVMLDSDLAELYGVETRVLNQAVRRTIERFPEDFIFQLTSEETAALRSHVVILKSGGRGQHRKYLPYAFTEQGVAMLSSVLHSKRAIQVNIAIMRVFVKLRQVLSFHKDLSDKLVQLESQLERHDAEIGTLGTQFRVISAGGLFYLTKGFLA